MEDDKQQYSLRFLLFLYLQQIIKHNSFLEWKLKMLKLKDGKKNSQRTKQKLSCEIQSEEKYF